MEQKIQLIHPAGKKAISMDTGKYDVLHKAILSCLKTSGESSHAEIFRWITEDFNKNNINFEGSVEWHLEWVKLDMEAKKEIKRLDAESPIKFTIG